ncbi:MAG: molybdopterin oxidoreductase family protein [Gammaproteobacteria bacterium]|nr:MAG: molybdopterin oxidoreductase family protein [Gammaproteobacteria bacterium]
MSTHHRTCNLCEANCGLVIETEDNHITRIQGDQQDPLSRGHICPKAVALQDLHDDPDRLRTPMRRTDTGWEPMSWPDALDLAARRLIEVREEHGRGAIGAYVGNPNVHHHGNMLFMVPFLKALGTRKRFSATSLDQLPHMLAHLKMFGHQGLFPVPDIERTKLFICVGGNPLASNGSLMTAPGMDKRLKALRKAGGRVIVIDPRRTETAAAADAHHFIRPGTDVLMLFALLNVLFEHNWLRLGHLKDHVKGLDVLKVAAQPFTPEAVAAQTGLAPDTLRALAKDLYDTPEAVLYGRMGVSVQAFGGLCTWLIYVINILTGHFDRRGGMMFAEPAIDMVGFGALAGQTGHFDKYRSSVRGLPEFGGELPAATLAEEILEAGDDRIRALVTVAGNPVLSAPNGQKLDKALASLDFMVSVDPHITETSRHAHLILPVTSALERSFIDVVFGMVAVRNTVKYSRPLFKPEKGQLADWEVMLELTRRLRNPKTLADTVQVELEAMLMQKLGPDGLADLLLRAGPYGARLPVDARWVKRINGWMKRLPRRHPLRLLWETSASHPDHQGNTHGLTLKKVADAPHGLDLGPLRPCLPGRLFTRDRKIDLAPSLYLEDIPRAVARMRQPVDSDSLLLIGRRHVRSNNSWMHNSQRLVKGKNRCTLMVHTKDAHRLGLKDGQLAEIRSRVGAVQAPVEVTDAIMPGVVSLPHGWGHHRAGVSWKTAADHAGVSLNDLTDDQAVDPLSGNAVLNGTPVTVALVKVPRARKTASKKRAVQNAE